MTVDDTSAARRGGRLLIPRSRGAFSGFLLIILGSWGALVPFIGPYFNYAYTPDSTWTWTTGRLWLEVVPGAAAALGGLILLMTANRVSALFGGWLASAAGAWFVVGPIVSRLWGGEAAETGNPIGGPKRQVIEQLGFFAGLGVVIIFLAAHAAGRVTVRSLRDLEAVDRRAAVDSTRTDEPRRGFGRRNKRRDGGVRDERHRDERHRDERHRDERHRDEGHRDEPRVGDRETGSDSTTVGGHSGATPFGNDEPRSDT